MVPLFLPPHANVTFDEAPSSPCSQSDISTETSSTVSRLPLALPAEIDIDYTLDDHAIGYFFASEGQVDQRNMCCQSILTEHQKHEQTHTKTNAAVF